MLSSSGLGGSVWVHDAVTDEVGNSYVTGTMTGTVEFGSTTLSAQGFTHDAFVAKLTVAGNWSWAHRLGGSAGSGPWDRGLAIALGGDDDLFIAADLEAGGLVYDATPVSIPYTGGMCVVKLDTAGSWHWVAATDVSSNLFVRLVADPTGNAYVAGHWNPGSSPPVHFGPFTVSADGTDDAFVARVDPSGSWEWAKTFNSIGSTIAFVVKDLLLDPDNNLVVAGYFAGSEAFIDATMLVANPQIDTWTHVTPFIGKWAPDGTMLWLTSTGTAYVGGCEIQTIDLDQSGELIVLAYATDTVNFGPVQLVGNNPAFANQVVAHLTTAGTWTDASFASRQGSNLTTDVAIRDDGSRFGAGIFNSTSIMGGDTVQSWGDNDVFVTSESPSGTWNGVATCGGTQVDHAQRINLLPNGIRVFGWFSGTSIFGPDTLTCVGTTCGFIGMLDIGTVGVNEPGGHNSSSLYVFPNPTASRINFVLPHAVATREFSIHDAFGRSVISGRSATDRTSIEISHLDPGSYVLCSGTSCARFIKE